MTHYIDEKARRESSFVNSSSDNFGEQLVDYSDGRFIMKKESTEKCAKSVQAHEGPVFALVLAKSCLISAGGDKSIKFWNPETLECLNVIRDAHKEPIKALTLCSNETLLASGSVDKQIKLWSLNNFQCIGTLSGHEGSVYALAVNVNNQDQLFSGSFDNQIKLWDLKTGLVIKTFHGQYCFWSLMTTKRGELISGSSDSCVKFWDIQSKERFNLLARTNIEEKYRLFRYD